MNEIKWWWKRSSVEIQREREKNHELYFSSDVKWYFINFCFSSFTIFCVFKFSIQRRTIIVCWLLHIMLYIGCFVDVDVAC